MFVESNMMIQWNQIYSNGIETNDDTILDMPLFADDQILVSEVEL
jgi:hypothetical protein